MSLGVRALRHFKGGDRVSLRPDHRVGVDPPAARASSPYCDRPPRIGGGREPVESIANGPTGEEVRRCTRSPAAARDLTRDPALACKASEEDHFREPRRA